MNQSFRRYDSISIRSRSSESIQDNHNPEEREMFQRNSQISLKKIQQKTESENLLSKVNKLVEDLEKLTNAITQNIPNRFERLEELIKFNKEESEKNSKETQEKLNFISKKLDLFEPFLNQPSNLEEISSIVTDEIIKSANKEDHYINYKILENKKPSIRSTIMNELRKLQVYSKQSFNSDEISTKLNSTHNLPYCLPPEIENISKNFEEGLKQLKNSLQKMENKYQELNQFENTHLKIENISELLQVQTSMLMKFDTSFQSIENSFAQSRSQINELKSLRCLPVPGNEKKQEVFPEFERPFEYPKDEIMKKNEQSSNMLDNYSLINSEKNDKIYFESITDIKIIENISERFDEAFQRYETFKNSLNN